MRTVRVEVDVLPAASVATDLCRDRLAELDSRRLRVTVRD
jgi:hypothetical protein